MCIRYSCYDMDGKKEIQRPTDMFGPYLSIFWAEESGLYYTKQAENFVYRYDISRGKEEALGKTPGQPRGLIDGKVISISFTQRQVLSSQLGATATPQVLYQGGTDLLSMEVVGGQLYLTRTGGLYRLQADGKLALLSAYYTAIGGVSGDIFVAVRKCSKGDVGLTEAVQLIITDGKKAGTIGDINAFDLSVSALGGRISADGERLLLKDYRDGL